jgi:hypothetical protein
MNVGGQDREQACQAVRLELVKRVLGVKEQYPNRASGGRRR